MVVNVQYAPYAYTHRRVRSVRRRDRRAHTLDRPPATPRLARRSVQNGREYVHHCLDRPFAVAVG
jgi:hypothetical protein